MEKTISDTNQTQGEIARKALIESIAIGCEAAKPSSSIKGADDGQSMALMMAVENFDVEASRCAAQAGGEPVEAFGGGVRQRPYGDRKLGGHRIGCGRRG